MTEIVHGFRLPVIDQGVACGRGGRESPSTVEVSGGTARQVVGIPALAGIRRLGAWRETRSIANRARSAGTPSLAS